MCLPACPRASSPRHAWRWLTAFACLLRDNLAGFVVDRRKRNQVLPTSVVQQLERASECGDPAQGHATIGCSACGFTKDVALSCKGRICPHCLTRRMRERATHLVENIFGSTPVRHFVGSFPPQLKSNIGFDRGLLTGSLGCFVEAISHWQRSKAVELLGLSSDAMVYTGMASTQHRWSSTLVTNFHFHFIVPDGVYVQRTPDGPVEFITLPAPTRDELAGIAAHACRLVCELLARRGFWQQSVEGTSADRVRGHLTYGTPRWITFFGAAADSPDFEVDDAADGNRAYPFTIYAGKRIQDRVHLENLALYIMSPPFTDDQVSIDIDGNVKFRPKRSWHEECSEITMTPYAFLDRVAPLIAPARWNANRYHGVFASNARLRKQVVALRNEIARPNPLQGKPANQPLTLSEQRMLLRVRSQEAELPLCPRCQTPLELIELVTPRFHYKNPRWLPPDTPRGPADEPATHETWLVSP